MNPLLSALVLSAALTTPAISGGVHDFNPENRRPVANAPSGVGKCITTRDKSHVCYLKVSNQHYSLAIHDVDQPGYATTVFIDCQTGTWKSWGILKKEVLDLYMHDFCTAV
jgi:hypothetical protein